METTKINHVLQFIINLIPDKIPKEDGQRFPQIRDFLITLLEEDDFKSKDRKLTDLELEGFHYFFNFFKKLDYSDEENRRENTWAIMRYIYAVLKEVGVDFRVGGKNFGLAEHDRAAHNYKEPFKFWEDDLIKFD